jgi:2-methylcitrate dehydratase
MEYLVDMTTHVPDGTTAAAVEEMRKREAARSAELSAEGALVRLWRPPLAPGQWRTFGLFDADDAEALEKVLSSMPLRSWRTDAVTPLAVHPNDPGSTARLGAPEFLISMSIAVPPGTSGDVVEDTLAREARRARELAAQGHLERLWALPTKDNHRRTLGLWSADDRDQISAIVAELPLRGWMDVDITALSVHPNDPASKSTGGKSNSSPHGVVLAPSAPSTTPVYEVERLGRFVTDVTLADLGASLPTLKRNVLDSIACALGALDGELVAAIRAQAEQFSSQPTATFIGGGRASVDQAAFFNAVLVRYPDLLDTYLTPGGLCHPADNFGAVLAVAEHAGASGADFLLALAIAYEVQCRFSAQVPVMARGLNHALPLAMSVAAGASRLLAFDAEHTASAIAASATDNVSLAAMHAEPVATWKGISPAITGMRAIYTTILAGRGATGPYSLFEGPHGLVQLFDQPIDFRTDDRSLHAVEQTYLKKYCALIHGQNIIDATLAIRDGEYVTGNDVTAVLLEVFDGAYDFAGGGRYGNKDHPQTKEQADYNLKYLCAVALLDGQVGPEQLETERVRRADVQDLLRRVTVTPADDLTAAYPQRTSTRVHVTLNDGRHFHREQSDFEGSPTQPLTWQRVVDKFTWLAEPFADEELQADIVGAVDHLEAISVAELTNLLAAVSPNPKGPRSHGRF